MKTKWKVLVIIDTILVFCLVIGFGIYIFSESSSFDDFSLSETEQNSVNSETTVPNVSQDNKKEAQEMFEDDYIKVGFVEWYNDDFVKDVTYLKLIVENKSDKNIVVSLKDVSVNGTMVNTGSGTPMVITPNKSSQEPFILFTGAVDINSVDEFDEVSIKMLILDNDTNETLEETHQWRIYKK